MGRRHVGVRSSEASPGEWSVTSAVSFAAFFVVCGVLFVLTSFEARYVTTSFPGIIAASAYHLFGVTRVKLDVGWQFFGLSLGCGALGE